MKLTEILAAQALLETAYSQNSQNNAELIVTGLEKSINNHLLMLWTMPDSVDASHWLTEVLNWLDEVNEIMLKPDNRRPAAAFYFRILFDEPFGGAEVQNLTSRLRRLQRQSYKFTTNASPEDLVRRLRDFHTAFSTQCAAASVTEDQLKALIF